ncbi:MAG: hypothetical protein HZC22_17070 [Rhodocyclales bacterium]|nr:hypothetical protein [Rhodocyclales bacterium]
MQYKKLACVLAACAALLLSGCASFRNNEIADVGVLPDVSRYATKPSVFVETHFYRGDPASAPVETLTIKDKVKEKIGQTLSESTLFSKYSFDEKDRTDADYAIRIDIYNHGEQGLAALAGFISGFTFGVIPAAATDNYTLEAKLLDRSGTVVSTSRNKDSITTWIGIWFLPMAASTPDKAFSATLDNQLKAVLKELVEGGKLKYSELRRLSAGLLVG